MEIGESKSAEEVDIITKMFADGFNDILERILFNVPPRTMAIFKEVNRNWASIFRHFQNTSNSRLLTIMEQKLNNSWQHGNPMLDIISLPGVGKYCQNFHHVVMDEEIVAVVGLFSDHPAIYGELYIHIYDIITLRILKLIPISSILPTAFHFCPKIILSLTADQLYMSGHICGKNYWASWSRKNDFILTAAEYNKNIGLQFINWSIGPEGCTTEICLQAYLKNTENVSLINNGYRVSIDETSYFDISFDDTFASIGFFREKVEVWRKTRRKSMRLIGFNADTVSLNWHERDWTDCVVEAYELSSGYLLQKFDLSKDYRFVYKAQISHGRIAIRCQSRDRQRKSDLCVFDLQSGKKLLQARSFLNTSNETEDFSLSKNRIVLLERGEWSDIGKYGKVFSIKYGN